MKRRESMMMGLLFWLLYCPLSFVIWYFQGAKSLTELIIALGIGVLIFALYLTMDFIFWALTPTYRRVPVITGGNLVPVSLPPTPEQDSPPHIPQQESEIQAEEEPVVAVQVREEEGIDLD